MKRYDALLYADPHTYADILDMMRRYCKGKCGRKRDEFRKECKECDMMLCLNPWRVRPIREYKPW